MDDRYFDIFEDDVKLPSAAPDGAEGGAARKGIPGRPLFEKETPRTEVRDEFEINGTRHEAVTPFGAAYAPLPHTASCEAKTYRFELDIFQHLSIAAIERDESVLVSAHTSCGKTVVAEYAIARSLRAAQRVVYTSPIKALSNQKFRELAEEFKDVGLMTGDVTINPTASVLVMTTEIFRNMLYRGSEVIREVRWVIFDEIHYMRDKERGVVWEETIILLPPHVRMVFLSATIPNAREFAEWICTVAGQPVHVVYTEQRVVPLLHYFYSDELRLIHDGRFHPRAFASSQEAPVKRTDVGKALSALLEQVAVPAVVFSFSRRDCETYAVGTRQDFLNSEEKEQVKIIFDNAIASLRVEDRTIPIIEKMLPLLQRGIGIHHSGLLPIIREVTEILFQESLVRVLFATETFAIGLNMPARSVVFTSLVKFDGTSRRLLSSGEYTQMSGRAGRRGLDPQGTAVAIVSEPLAPAQARGLFSSCSDRLLSAFRLTYNMVLNLMRVEGLDPLYILSRSFFHFQAYKAALSEEQSIADALAAYDRMCSARSLQGAAADTDGSAACRVHELLVERESLLVERNRALSATYLDHIRMKGRVVDVMLPRDGAPLLIRNAVVKSVSGDVFSAFVLTNKGIEMREFPLECITEVYNIRVKIDIKVFNKRFRGIAFANDWDAKIRETESAIKKEANVDFSCCLLCKRPARSCLVECTAPEDGRRQTGGVLDEAVLRIRQTATLQTLQTRIDNLERLKEIYHMAECKRMINVLRMLGHIDETSVLIKGKMASEISTGDELVITEMIFSSSFTALPLVDMIALVSCTICEEKSTGTPSEANSRCFDILSVSTERVCAAMRACGMEITLEAYLGRFSSELMDVVRLWMGGATFVTICESTSVFEGTIIRTFKRLEELLRQLSSAALVIGNTELADLFGQGIFLIKRDIVFANSLYL